MTDAVKTAVRRRPFTAEETFTKENVLKVEILNENVSKMQIDAQEKSGFGKLPL